MIAVTGIVRWYNRVNVTEDEPMDAKDSTPINQFVELTAMADMQAGDILTIDLEAMTATHTTDWNFTGLAMTDCKAGEKLTVFKIYLMNNHDNPPA